MLAVTLLGEESSFDAAEELSHTLMSSERSSLSDAGHGLLPSEIGSLATLQRCVAKFPQMYESALN